MKEAINPYGHEIMGYTYRNAGRLDDAIAALRTQLSLSPNSWAHSSIGELLLQKGDPGGALVEMQQERFDSERLFGLCMTYFALGRRVESDAALAALMEKYGKVYSFKIAAALAYRGEADRAFEWLDKAVKCNDLYLSAVASTQRSPTSTRTRAGCPFSTGSAWPSTNSQRSSST